MFIFYVYTKVNAFKNHSICTTTIAVIFSEHLYKTRIILKTLYGVMNGYHMCPYIEVFSIIPVICASSCFVYIYKNLCKLLKMFICTCCVCCYPIVFYLIAVSYLYRIVQFYLTSSIFFLQAGNRGSSVQISTPLYNEFHA